MIKKILYLLCLIFVLSILEVGCGSDSGGAESKEESFIEKSDEDSSDSSEKSSTTSEINLNLQFIEDSNAKKDKSVTLSFVKAQNDEITLSIDANNISDMFGIALRLNFDPSFLKLENIELINILGENGIILGKENPLGRVVIGLTKKYDRSGTSINGSKSFVKLTFKKLQKGETPIAFDQIFSSVRGADLSKLDISFYGGKIKEKE